MEWRVPRKYALEGVRTVRAGVKPAVFRVRVSAAALAIGIGGCQGIHQSVDFERHSMSTLYESRSGDGALIFEAKTDSQFPADDAAAEGRRIEWLEGWLGTRKLCPNGYDIVERKPIGRNDINTYRNDLRYVLKCKN